MEMTVVNPEDKAMVSGAVKSELSSIVDAGLSLKQVEIGLEKVYKLDILQRKEIYLKQGCYLGIAKEQHFETSKEWLDWAKTQGFSVSIAKQRVQVAEALVGLSPRNITTKKVAGGSPTKKAISYTDLANPNRAPSARREYVAPIDAEIAKVTARASAFKAGLSEDRDEKEIEGLMKKIVSIGFKALSTKLHPDKGGTSEAFSRLKEARDRLLLR